MAEDVRCLVLVESGGTWEATDLHGRPHALPPGVTPRHVAAMLDLLARGNATPLLACVPPHALPRVSSPESPGPGQNRPGGLPGTDLRRPTLECRGEGR